MKDKITGARIKQAERELVSAYANAEKHTNPAFIDYYLNKAIKQEKLIKQLKGIE